ncbi:uncharacterized protein LOC120752447 isoform X1 [Hirundo rustica]|uniref:uncharacterized protein LOC120758439 isoform X1 n=1 Tax=Hirundo rustica TaxID=43150 RepID=UPI001A9538A5|nr:uncharacterized protein LOC120758439 isoform X1 [Hirundo rustica]XP_039932623.1 uncharacterized protein LOC120758439 isoform X1 [Hirundo rustica]XP_039932624.1 uncharacterized protein LOC120758439 isoform X1 [Hirundo rustica]XP_058276424.1 uncharacterized protein LOC120752447 isoform X1 [Hirundo rustica]
MAGGSGEKKGRRKSRICRTWSSLIHANCNVKFSLSLESALDGGIVTTFLIFFLCLFFWSLQEVIRVILGNLDDLHPFSTDHFTVFPYLSKWERVSKMKFKHENVHLVPYPYMCTLYLELNSFQQNVSCGKEVKKGSDERNSSKANELEFCAASLTKDCDQLSFWEPVEFALEQKRAVSQAEGAVQLLQQMDQTGKKGDMKSGGGGLSQFWRSIIFSPLQHLFGGKK